MTVEYQGLLADERLRVAEEAANRTRGRGGVFLAAKGAERMRQGTRSMLGIEEPVVAEAKAKAAKDAKLQSILSKYPNMKTRADYQKAINELYINGYTSFANEILNLMKELPEENKKPETYSSSDGTRYLTSGTYNGVDYKAGDLVPGETKSQSTSTNQYDIQEVKTEDLDGNDIIETWQVDPDGRITAEKPLFIQRPDADGGSTGIALALNFLQDNPEFQTAVASKDSATINRMIKETLEQIKPEEKKDRTMKLVGEVWRYTDGDQEQVFSDQDIPEDADAKAEEIYASYFEEHPKLFNTPEGNIRLAKDLVAAKLTSTKIFSDLMSSVGQDGQNAIRQEELTVRAIERLSDNYVDSGVSGMDSLLAPIESSIAANMKQVVKDGKVVWTGKLPGWDLTNSLDKWLPGSKGYAAREFAGQAASLINTVLRQRSGAAVTEPEWDRLVQEFTGGRIKTSAQFANWVGRMRDYNEKTKGYIMAGYEPLVQNRFMANKGSYIKINPETEMGLVPIGGWFISSTDGKVYRKDK